MTAETKENPGEAQARRLESVGEQVSKLIRQSDTDQRFRAAPGENEWSAMQILGHMVEMIPYWLSHCQMMIASTVEPHQFGRSLDAPERLAGVERPQTVSSDELLSLLNDEIRSAANVVRQMTPAERSQRGIYQGRDEMTVADVIEVFIVAHAEDHLAQMRAAVKT